MSEPAAAASSGGDRVEEEDCPLCLEPLPPFWDLNRRAVLICCGRCMCLDCSDKRSEFLQRAFDDGSYGRQEEQLNRTCPLCRTLIPADDDLARMMMEKFENGELPLHMYRDLAIDFIAGEGGVERNVERGMEILKLGAEKGDSKCQYVLGGKYYEGSDGLPKSKAEAKLWVVAAANQGHAPAEYNLAIMLKDEGNYAEYLRFLEGSATKGYDDACHLLGLAHYNGDCGLQKSSEEAIRVLTPAAERGHADSMCLLGAAMCKPDQWVPPADNPNFTRGIHWMRRAAETGDEDAVSNLKGVEEAASRMCFRCKEVAPQETAFLRCSRCRAAWYCSKDCQRRHWKATERGHKQFCIKWK